MKAILAKHFDTYAGDSSQLETFLSQEVLEGDILVVVTFDEASRNLSPTAKNMFAKLGVFFVVLSVLFVGGTCVVTVVILVCLFLLL
ncbi:hypothetical protein E2C01_070945 [Portunus trituberculatus]|uniref:ILEI/PANDER domain-containing protein n=1 Tax=Portunus trituberculatus TaxID=210409 RepID=A0A5B7I3W4_PORTR|nr:hypothetical protein [Portunus trituberculatus]